MGFGYLFLGYFFLLFFPMSGIGVLPNLAAVGCVIMFFGLRKLYSYAPECKGFKLAIFALIPYFAVSVAEFASDVAEYSGRIAVDSVFVKSTALVSDLLFGIFTVFVLVGIHVLARQVELPKIAVRSSVFMSISVIFTLCAAVSGIAALVDIPAGKTATAVVNYIALAAFLLEYLAIFLNLFHIFSCYMYICLEGDEDMPYREDIFDKLIAFTRRNKK